MYPIEHIQPYREKENVLYTFHLLTNNYYCYVKTNHVKHPIHDAGSMTWIYFWPLLVKGIVWRMVHYFFIPQYSFHAAFYIIKFNIIHLMSWI